MHADDPGEATVLAVNVGNTRTSFALYTGADAEHRHALANAQPDAVADSIAAHAAGAEGCPILIASVNPPVADRLAGALARAVGDERVLRIGDDVGIPVRHTLDESGERTVGQDRLLNALAAFDVVRQACVVVDAGTAITVDFVDGEGVFHGGAIMPGARMMLRSMNAGAAGLPEVELRAPPTLAEPDSGPFGRNTTDAMLTGVFFAARGAVRALAERYAEFYQAYPQVIATGGDAGALFEGDDIIEAIVPDLTLRGVALAWRAAMSDGPGDHAG